MLRIIRYLCPLLMLFAACYGRELDALQKEHHRTLRRLSQLNHQLEDLRQKPALQIDSLMKLERGELSDTNLIKAYQRIYAQNAANFWSRVALQRIELLEYKLIRQQIIGRWRMEQPAKLAAENAPADAWLVFQDEEHYLLQRKGQPAVSGRYRLSRHEVHQNLLLQLEHADNRLWIDFDKNYKRFQLGELLTTASKPATYVRMDR